MVQLVVVAFGEYGKPPSPYDCEEEYNSKINNLSELSGSERLPVLLAQDLQVMKESGTT
jgi:hypothetical protein